MSTTTLNRTPFYEFHVEQGAKMVEFAGWAMPILYRSIIDEHRQVRASGGVFDVSHMGRLRVHGPDAQRFLDRICTRRILGMAVGQCRYALVLNEHGGCRDDTVIFRVGDQEYLLVCNAANRSKLLDHFENVRGDLEFDLVDQTTESGMLAVQGPKVIDLVAGLVPELAGLKRYRLVVKDLLGARIIIARTGYTGEDGVEVIMPASLAERAIELMLSDVGAADAPVKPAGLGARDTLRMEAAMPLYGHEITEDIDPVSAGLAFAVKLDKGEGEDEAGRFIGQEALKRIAREGPRRRLAGLILEGKRTARQGMTVQAGGAQIGVVTSACFSPTLARPIALAYLDATHAEPGGAVRVDLGSAPASARVVELPFYKR